MPTSHGSIQIETTMPLFHFNKSPSNRELMWFGVLFPCFAAGVAVVLWWKYGAGVSAAVVLGAGALLGAVFLAAPRVRRPLYLAWMYATMPIGVVVSIVLLAVTFFLVVTPVGLLVRWLSGDPMSRGFDPKAGTYWTRRPPPAAAERYFRQF